MNLNNRQGNRTASIISAFGYLPGPILSIASFQINFQGGLKRRLCYKLLKPESLDNAILELYHALQIW